ncbi:MAG: hypothetical protein WKF79_13295 [Nocardioides sp.]
MTDSGTAVDSLALSVHGPRGVLDLMVPAGASSSDVATAYAAQTRLDPAPTLCTHRGTMLAPDDVLADAGITSGALLVAMPSEASHTMVRSRRALRLRRGKEQPGRVSALWFCLSAGLALLAGWCTTRMEDGDLRTTVIGVLAGACVIGLLPVGHYAGQRVVAAPAFAGAAAFAVAWDPAPERLPTILGVSALAAGVAAAVGRSLETDSEEPLRVWMVAGMAVFVVTAGTALAGTAPQVAWSVLLVVAMLAARFVPALAINIPDQFLIDVERLAVTAWSARDRPTGRRTRIVVPHQAVVAVAERGKRLVIASCVAIAAIAAIASPLLLLTATLPLDRVGARCLVLFSGGALLFAARSYRHDVARALLRTAGLACLTSVVTVMLIGFDRPGVVAVASVAIATAGLLILVAVALGRGWRSAWWSRRAEVGEGICGAFAVSSVVVAVGLFRHLWELTG